LYIWGKLNNKLNNKTFYFNFRIFVFEKRAWNRSVSPPLTVNSLKLYSWPDLYRCDHVIPPYLSDSQLFFIWPTFDIFFRTFTLFRASLALTTHSPFHTPFISSRYDFQTVNPFTVSIHPLRFELLQIPILFFNNHPITRITTLLLYNISRYFL
jgi:hypothetical protein